MPDTDDPYGLAPKVNPSIQRPSRERGEDILHHTPSVTPRGIAPSDTMLCAVARVDMVVACGGRGDHTHATTREQGLITVDDTTDEEHICTTYGLGAEGTTL